MQYRHLQISAQPDTNLKVIEPFGELTKGKGKVGETSKTSADIYSCQESGCVLTFKSQQEADAHMDTGKHNKELQSESLYDTIRKNGQAELKVLQWLGSASKLQSESPTRKLNHQMVLVKIGRHMLTSYLPREHIRAGQPNRAQGRSCSGQQANETGERC